MQKVASVLLKEEQRKICKELGKKAYEKAARNYAESMLEHWKELGKKLVSKPGEDPGFCNGGSV